MPNCLPYLTYSLSADLKSNADSRSLNPIPIFADLDELGSLSLKMRHELLVMHSTYGVRAVPEDKVSRAVDNCVDKRYDILLRLDMDRTITKFYQIFFAGR